MAHLAQISGVMARVVFNPNLNLILTFILTLCKGASLSLLIFCERANCGSMALTLDLRVLTRFKNTKASSDFQGFTQQLPSGFQGVISASLFLNGLFMTYSILFLIWL